MSHPPAILWFRRDLRLTDNPALQAAIKHGGERVVCLYIRETETETRHLGGASNWWLDKSLRRLQSDIEALGGTLVLRTGNAASILASVLSETGSTRVFWNRRYEKAARDLDAAIKADLQKEGVDVESFNGSLLTVPWHLKTSSGGYYKVFTPYWRALRSSYTCPPMAQTTSRLRTFSIRSEHIDDWALHPTKPDWSTGFHREWTPGEASAKARLAAFLDDAIGSYSEDRDRPDLESGTSKLSPHLAFGEISPTQIWRAVQARIDAGSINESHAWKFLSEVAWRDFSYNLLFHNPDLATENYKSEFDHLPWRGDAKGLEAWQNGRTGYPIVDAGMRQLWQTGWMHNRVRMIVASFLTKHLLVHWTEGEEWFWDTLVDADPASNSASWQWTAGSGADAAPYFRVFNPILQGEKFDVTGDYVRKWCPELRSVPQKYLFQPWTAPASILRDAGIELGNTYPHPIVDHKFGRERALEAYNQLKTKRDAA